MRRKMVLTVTAIVLAGLGWVGWKFTVRGAYESPEYTLIMRDGLMEVREYPEMVLATTSMKSGPIGGDGSFGRLFGYISGKNEDNRKLAMTVPVFMGQDGDSDGQMAFVVPSRVAKAGAPQPSSDNVAIKTRPAGRFAVIRFSGRISPELISKNEATLRTWIETQGLVAGSTVDAAGYDPPWLPGALRRNEVLIRVTGAGGDSNTE